MDPPHQRLSRYNSIICQGHEFGVASSPPIMRGVIEVDGIAGNPQFTGTNRHGGLISCSISITKCTFGLLKSRHSLDQTSGIFHCRNLQYSKGLLLNSSILETPLHIYNLT